MKTISIDTLRDYEDRKLLRSQTHPTLDLIIWNYTEKVQYERLWDDITLQCRGLVTNVHGDIIALPFEKFFNIEEIQFDLNLNASEYEYEIYEKLDGSLIIAFWYYGEFVVATRGSFVSDQAIAADKILRQICYKLHHKFTFLFEYTAPWNRIVCDYGNDERLTLIGAINTLTGYDLTYQELIRCAHTFEVDLMKRYEFHNLNNFLELKSFVRENKEGFVIRLENGSRIKVKGEEYVRLHKLVSQISTLDIWNILSNNGTISEILEHVPDEYYTTISEYANFLISEFNRLEEEVYSCYAAIMKVTDNRKDFALRAKLFPYSSALFKLYDRHDNINNILWKLIKPDYKRL